MAAAVPVQSPEAYSVTTLNGSAVPLMLGVVLGSGEAGSLVIEGAGGATVSAVAQMRYGGALPAVSNVWQGSVVGVPV